MKLKTKNFGKVDIEANEVIEFIQPFFGFEDFRQFVMLYDKNKTLENRVCWLQSVESVDLCFTLINANVLKEIYSPEIPQKVVKVLGEDSQLWVVFALDATAGATVNLRSPIAIKNNKAVQVILSEDYPIEEPIDRGVI